MATVKQIELKLKRINTKIDKLTKDIGAAKKEKIKAADDLKKAKAKAPKATKAAGKKGKSAAASKKKASPRKTAKKKAPAKKTVVNVNNESLLS